jgi:hypothetical protein
MHTLTVGVPSRPRGVRQWAWRRRLGSPASGLWVPGNAWPAVLLGSARAARPSGHFLNARAGRVPAPPMAGSSRIVERLTRPKDGHHAQPRSPRRRDQRRRCRALTRPSASGRKAAIAKQAASLDLLLPEADVTGQQCARPRRAPLTPAARSQRASLAFQRRRVGSRVRRRQLRERSPRSTARHASLFLSSSSPLRCGRAR